MYLFALWLFLLSAAYFCKDQCGIDIFPRNHTCIYIFKLFLAYNSLWYLLIVLIYCTNSFVFLNM